MFGSKMMSCGGNADLFGEDPVARGRRSRPCRSIGVGLALLVEGHHDHGGAVAAAEAGLFDELLLALLERDRIHDGLALHAAQAGLDDADHFDESIMNGTRAMSGSVADQVQEPRHRRGRRRASLVHVDVDDLRAGFDLLLRHVSARRA
jgi:hypothetical protein